MGEEVGGRGGERWVQWEVSGMRDTKVGKGRCGGWEVGEMGGGEGEVGEMGGGEGEVGEMGGRYSEG